MAAVLELYTGNRTLLLGNEQLCRKMNFGADWSALRILMRAAHYATGSFLLDMRFGVTRDMRGYGAADSDSLGVAITQNVSISGTPRTFTWNWGPAYFYNWYSLNNVVTTSGNGNNGARTGQLYPAFNLWGVDIVRSGNNFAVSIFSLKSASTIVPLASPIAWENFMFEWPQMPNVSGSPNTGDSDPANTITTYASSGGSGLLDSILIKNGSSAAPFCITDIVVTRFN